MTALRHVLVTGYPGFIARRLTKKLLTVDDQSRFTLLVEPSQKAHAQQELSRITEHTGDLNVDERVRILIGDVTAMDLGLSGDEFREVTQKTNEIYHLAALHALDADAKRMDTVNVHGTQNVLNLARGMKALERLVHFSSAYVSGNRTGVIMEDELEAGQNFRNAYEASKYQAEVLVRRAAHQLPITIIRPSGVVGDSRTGEIDRFDSVYHLGMILVASPVAIPVPLAGEGHAPLNLVPVDYLVDAVNIITGEPTTLGKTFHVVDPNPLSARRVYEAVASHAGRKLPRIQVSPNLTKALLRIPGLERWAPVSHQAIDYLNHMAFYNQRHTAETLAETGVHCPSFDEYVDNLVQYVRDYFERAKT